MKSELGHVLRSKPSNVIGKINTHSAIIIHDGLELRARNGTTSMNGKKRDCIAARYQICCLMSCIFIIIV